MAVPGKGSAATVTTPTVTVSPAATVPSAQTIVTPSPDEQPVDDTNVSPAGNVSVTTTLVAAAAEALVTVKVKGTWPPGSICAAVVVFPIVSWGCRGTDSVEEQSTPPEPSFGQLVPGEVTDAVLDTVPSAATSAAGKGLAATVTTFTATVAFAATVPSSQVMVRPSAEPTHTLGEADTNVSPAGSVSEIETDVAGAGVVLATVNE